MIALGADGPRARVRVSREWGWQAWPIAVCALALGAGACNKPLVFTDPGNRAAGGVTGNNADAGTGGAGRTGSGGMTGTGGTPGSGGTGSTSGTGGTNGSGGAGGSIDAAVDQRVDVPPDVRDTGPDVRDTGVDVRPDTGPITTVVCANAADCKLPGLTCLIPAGQPGRCVECTGTGNCTGANKVCDSISNRCVECTNAVNDCGTTTSEHVPQCSTTHRCLNGCSDDIPGTTDKCPSAAQTCVTGSMSSGPDLCLFCTANSQCGTGGTCVAPGFCVTCTSDTACAASNPAKPLCDTTFTGNCVQCRDSRDCVKYPGFPLCDPVALICKAVP